MRLFEADCPRQLVTEIGLAQRRRKKDKRVEQVEAEVARMYGKARKPEGAIGQPELEQEDLKGPMLKGIFNGMFKEGLKEVFKGIFRMKVLRL